MTSDIAPLCPTCGGPMIESFNGYLCSNDACANDNVYPKHTKDCEFPLCVCPSDPLPSEEAEANAPVSPCEIVVGHTRFQKGVRVSTIQGAINRLATKAAVDSLQSTLSAALTKIGELEAINDDLSAASLRLVNASRNAAPTLARMNNKIAALEIRTRQLEGALKPFAAFAGWVKNFRPGWNHDQFEVFKVEPYPRVLSSGADEGYCMLLKPFKQAATALSGPDAADGRGEG